MWEKEAREGGRTIERRDEEIKKSGEEEKSKYIDK